MIQPEAGGDVEYFVFQGNGNRPRQPLWQLPLWQQQLRRPLRQMSRGVAFRFLGVADPLSPVDCRLPPLLLPKYVLYRSLLTFDLNLTFDLSLSSLPCVV